MIKMDNNMHQGLNTIRSIYLQISLVVVILILLTVWQSAFIKQLYLEQSHGKMGIVLNLGIIFLFVIGILKTLQILSYYAKQYRDLDQVNNNVKAKSDVLMSVRPASLIAKRYQFFNQLTLNNAPINHSALAATLVASESTRLSLPRFVNSILILTGVFGTIVSLSIALLGASNMITSASEIAGLGAVIEGMSTALSTTMTAIIAFFIFNYFFQRINDVQTEFFARFEQVTTTKLMPLYSVEPEAILHDYSNLLKSTRQIIEKLQHNQQNVELGLQALEESIATFNQQASDNQQKYDQLIHILKKGFRLNEYE